MQGDLATFGGTVVIINAPDVQHEADTLAQLLQQNNVSITPIANVQAQFVPGRPYIRIWEEIAMQAKHFLVIPSDGLKRDLKLKELVYVAMGLSDEGKLTIPVKFSPTDSGMPFLDGRTPIRPYTA